MSFYHSFKEWLWETPVYPVLRSCKQWLLPASTQSLTAAALQNAEYESQLLQVLELALGPDSVCIDGGCHRGAVLQELCRLAPRACHFAFEPLPALYQRLIKHFPQQMILPYALADKSGTASFVHVENAPAYSGLRERDYDKLQASTKLITVEVRTLDELIPPEVMITLIKLDLEGGEYHALCGGKHMIRLSRPIILFESGEGSTGRYQVTGSMIYRLFNEELDYHLSTMARWLAGERQGFSREQFLDAYTQEFFYIAYPRQ